MVAILGLLSYGPMLNNPDYVTVRRSTTGSSSVRCSNCSRGGGGGDRAGFYPVLKKHAESITLGYVTFRLLEAVLIIVGAISMLTILALPVFAYEMSLAGWLITRASRTRRPRPRGSGT